MRGLIRILGAVITAPLVVAIGFALLVLWQLWFTGFTYDSSQDLLAAEFEAGNTSQPVGRLTIEAIGLDDWIMAGVSPDALTDGPGRYPGSAEPGGPGNLIIAGRRATYGRPFDQLDKLVVGDEITITDAAGEWTYAVVEPWLNTGSSNVIVGPETRGLLSDRGGAQLTMVALHPRFSSEARLVVIAELVGEVRDGPPLALDEDATIGLRGTTPDWDRLFIGFGLAAVFWLVVWMFGRPARRTVALQLLALILFVCVAAWTASVFGRSFPPV